MHIALGMLRIGRHTDQSANSQYARLLSVWHDGVSVEGRLVHLETLVCRVRGR